MTDKITWFLCQQELEKLEHMRKAKANIFQILYVNHGDTKVSATRSTFRTISNI